MKTITTTPAEIAGAAVRFEATDEGARVALRSMGFITELELDLDQRAQVAKLLTGTGPGRIEIELNTATVRDAVGGL
jgi:hypothetical protein